MDRVIESRWVMAPARALDNRLDVLRARADYLAQKIDHAPSGSRVRESREYAALMWAIAELSGIGDEVRQQRAEREYANAAMYRKAMKRADDATALNVQYREQIKAMKSEMHRLRQLLDQKQAVAS